MSNSPYIADIEPQQFGSLVLENSHKGTVMVYFWSPQAGPCNRLLPRLVRLADEAGGRFFLALLNTDQYRLFARDLGVTSIPTVLIYRSGQVSETIHGAWSESEFRRIIEKYVGSQRSVTHAAALQAAQLGEDQLALDLLRTKVTQSNNWRERIDLVKLLIRNQAFTECLREINELRLQQFEYSGIPDLLTHLEVVCIAGLAPPLAELLSSAHSPEENPEHLLQIGAIQLVNDDIESAVQTFQELRKTPDSILSKQAQHILDTLSRFQDEYR